MADLSKLEPMDEQGKILAIIESPRGSRAKLKYEPSLGVFTVSRVLPLCVPYPFDRGFIPGTVGPDGDPSTRSCCGMSPAIPDCWFPVGR